ncbi:MAG: PstS family phosphate ABC transporter substrate-binding protein [Cytophagales bacterium]|nr:PstS family phosphate ABC transporter substrate-binding protein [Cytophaga sp.]
MKKIIFLALATSFMVACGGKKQSSEGTDSTSASSGSVKIDGSSTVFPISEAVAEEFEKANKGIKVTANASGTGAGFKKFIRNEIDISGASRPIKASEDKDCAANKIEYIEVPVAYDGLAIVVSKENTWVDFLTVAELKKLWEPSAKGTITHWDQVRTGWPHEKINLYGAGTESGTFDYFTEAIVGEAKSCRTDYTASEDDNGLVSGVAGDKYALGYFGYAYFFENQDKLKIVPIDDQNDANGKGAVTPDEKTIVDGSYQPLSRPLLIYVNKASAARPEVASFVHYYIDNATTLVPETGYVPLSPEAYKLVKARFDAGTSGSLFLTLKTTVGVKLEEVLQSTQSK